MAKKPNTSSERLTIKDHRSRTKSHSIAQHGIIGEDLLDECRVLDAILGRQLRDADALRDLPYLKK